MFTFTLLEKVLKVIDGPRILSLVVVIVSFHGSVPFKLDIVGNVSLNAVRDDLNLDDKAIRNTNFTF